MTQNTKIEWADHTFNPWWGCTKISPACDNCYAQALDKRTGGDHWGAGKPRKHTSIRNWLSPLKWNKHAEHFVECTGCGRRGDSRTWEADIIKAKPTAITCCPDRNLVKARPRVFCASMADVFDNEVPVSWRMDLFKLIAHTPNLDWLILTKRIGNVMPMCSGDSLMFDVIGQRVWLGITVCNQQEADRDIPKLLAVPAAKRFLSVEPMLGAINIGEVSCLNGCGKIIPTLCNGDKDMCCPRCGTYTTSCLPSKPNKPLEGIDWVICGGESGGGARPMHPYWARSLRDQCKAAGVPFLFKQWGEWHPQDEMPVKTKGWRRIDGQGMERVGKTNAGRLLDGVEHNGFPA